MLYFHPFFVPPSSLLTIGMNFFKQDVNPWKLHKVENALTKTIPNFPNLANMVQYSLHVLPMYQILRHPNNTEFYWSFRVEC